MDKQNRVEHLRIGSFFQPTDDDLHEKAHLLDLEIGRIMEEFNELNDKKLETLRELARRDAL